MRQGHHDIITDKEAFDFEALLCCRRFSMLRQLDSFLPDGFEDIMKMMMVQDHIKNFGMTFFKNTSVRRFTIYTLLVGATIGYYSALSDSMLPWEEQTAWQTFNYAISNILNDFVLWFVVAIITGYIFTKTWRRATFYGAIICLYAIGVYLVCNQLASNSSAAFDIIGLGVFIIMAIIGGALGGLIGHVMKKYPVVLVAPLGFTVYRIYGALPKTWSSPIGLPRNIFLCTVVVLICAYWILLIYRRLRIRSHVGK